MKRVVYNLVFGTAVVAMNDFRGHFSQVAVASDTDRSFTLKLPHVLCYRTFVILVRSVYFFITITLRSEEHVKFSSQSRSPKENIKKAFHQFHGSFLLRLSWKSGYTCVPFALLHKHQFF